MQYPHNDDGVQGMGRSHAAAKLLPLNRDVDDQGAQSHVKTACIATPGRKLSAQSCVVKADSLETCVCLLSSLNVRLHYNDVLVTGLH
jgi:hypothetical protein